MKNQKHRNWLIFSVILIFLASIIIPNISGSNMINKNYNNNKIGTLNALEVAQTHISLFEKEEYSIIDITEIQDNFKFPLMYIFILNPQGYIVVTADRCLPPIIAYSLTNDQRLLFHAGSRRSGGNGLDRFRAGSSPLAGG